MRRAQQDVATRSRAVRAASGARRASASATCETALRLASSREPTIALPSADRTPYRTVTPCETRRSWA